MGIAIVACLSYNMLMGQGGMLSFGHAVYTGLGAYAAVHALNAAGAGTWPIPVSLVPLLGGLAGMGFAALIGYVTTRKSGTTFAMITLGIAELVHAISLMFSEFFGGEAGVSTNRVVGEPFFGVSFASAVQIYYLIAAYTFLAVVAMFAFTGTPLGRMLNAVRDNPERVEFIGYNPQRIRYIVFVIAGFFAGIAGGLAALTFEIVTPEVFGSSRSGAYLLFTFLGGANFFFGPILGAVLMVLAYVLLSELTKAWLLYVGLIFVFAVMYAPGGIAGLIMMNLRVARFGKSRRLWASYAALLCASLLTLAGMGAVIEMVYHHQLNSVLGPHMHFLGLTLNTTRAGSWGGSIVVLLIGGIWFAAAADRFSREWGEIQDEIEQGIQRRDVQ